jgi:hypothetical protein
MKDLGKATRYLGMEVTMLDSSIKPTQSRYIREIVNRFNLHHLRPAKTPVEPGVKLTKETKREASQKFRQEYQELVGSLIHLAVKTRCDISFSVGLVSRYMSNPNEEHLKAAHRIVAYLLHTIDLGLHYQSTKPEIMGWVDTDYAGCLDTCRSTTGWIITLGGAPISWASKRQKTVSLSTCEAKYMAASEAAKEAIWIQGLMKELSLANTPIIPLHIDNDAALKLTKNPEHRERSKHIDVRYHFIREKVVAGEL